MAIFPFFKMAAVRQLVFRIMLFLGFIGVGSAHSRQCTKIGRSRPNGCGDFQDGGRRHLGFSEMQIFSGPLALETHSAPARQIASKSARPLLKYGDFSIFQDGGRPPS